MRTAKSPAIIAIGLSLAAFTAISRADDLQASALGGGQSNTGTTAASVSGAQGSASAIVNYGGVTLDADAVSTSIAHPIYLSSGSWFDTITINNPALTGQTGSARFTFSINGGFSLNSTAYNTAINYADVYWDKGQNNLAYDFTINTGTEFVPPISTITSFTHDYDFTFGTPFSINPGAAVRASGGNTGGSASVNLQISQVNMTVSSSGNPTPYSSSSNTGSAAATVVTNGSSFSGISLANSGRGSHGTLMRILDGVASADRTVNASFVGAGAFAGTSGTVIGDAVSLSGLGSTPGTATDIFTLQMSYDEADAIAQFGSESSMRLLWQNPATGLWENTVDGDFGGTPFFAGDGAYDPATDFHLGYYGVDTADNYVWAVVNHNSEFGAGQITAAPESSCSVLFVVGYATSIMRRWRRAVN